MQRSKLNDFLTDFFFKKTQNLTNSLIYETFVLFLISNIKIPLKFQNLTKAKI